MKMKMEMEMEMKKKILSILLMLCMVLTMIPSMAFADGGEPAQAPTSLTVAYEGLPVLNGNVIAKQGDKFQLKAYDQNGQETSVKWQTTSSQSCKLNEETGEVEITVAPSVGGTVYLYFTAISTLDDTVKSSSKSVKITGFQLSNQTVSLSNDGQSEKAVKLSGGVSGYNEWSFEKNSIQDIAALKAEPGNGGSIEFNCYRPGSFDVTVKVDNNDKLTDTKTVTIKGVAVETETGERTKTYLELGQNEENPTVRLTAYCEEGKSISSWSSSDENIATVDENGMVTAQGIGTALITATDSENATGGIKVVVSSSETPYFESIEFLKTTVDSSTWTAGETFSPTKTSYDLLIKTYSTSSLALTAATLYNTDKYTAVAKYTDASGIEKNIAVNSGAQTMLEGIPFDSSTIKITISDKADADKKTEYTFHVTRPRDVTKTIKSSGIVLSPVGRNLSSTKYKEQAEGTMFKANADGTLSSGTGVSGTAYYYRTYALDNLANFKLNLTGNSVYTHLRYSTDEGNSWTETAQGTGTTSEISFPAREGEENPEVKIIIQILDDKTYSENIKAGKDGFADSEPTIYTIWVEQIENVSVGAQITEATTDSGEWYPEFQPELYTYSIVVPNGTKTLDLKYKAAENAEIKIGTAVQTPDESGYYTLSLKTSAQTVTVTSEKGVINTYSFKLVAKSKYDVPDRVVDYLCINSQYTNVGYGTLPETTLGGSFKSIGNFGGYIEYYYEEGLKDDPNNKYGIDFYVYGNANKDTSTDTKTSFFEPAQVWVSEDGSKWYALAGSAHYEDGVDWNYEVKYTKTESGKTAWTDNHGNSNDGKSYTGAYPKAENYYFSDAAKLDTITLSGIVLPSRSGELAVSGQSVDAYPVKWGYADCFVNGTLGADVNPYLDNSNYDLAANGFDLEWAVDEDGNPIDVSEKEFHYIKLQTASNIWHTSFGEKSPEITAVIRTTAQSEAVGRTKTPTGVTISDGAETKTINFLDGQQIYEADLGSMKYVRISVNGIEDDANIYVNNERIKAGDAAEGIKVTKEAGEKLVRVIVQEGEKEPQVILLKLTSSAEESDELIEGVKINVSGSGRKASTLDGNIYTATVGYRIGKIGIAPVIKSSADYTIDGKAPEAEYNLEYGENTFEIKGTDPNGKTQTVTLKITREAAPPVSDKKIQVYFVLYGDDSHGDNGEIHTYQNSRGELKVWASNKAYEVPEGSTVLDVFEMAMKENNLTYVNDGGNYISSINGLAEFSNGPLSGWMYLMNGSHPSYGVSEQTVKNGDQITFHYTDDYTKEEGSDKWIASGEETAKEVTTSGSIGFATTTAPTEVTVSGTTATATVTKESAAEIIKQAGENKSTEIKVQVAADASKNADTVKLQLDTSFVKDVVNKTSANLTVETANGSVTLEKDILSQAVSEGSGSTITLEVVQVKNLTKEQKEAAGENAHFINLVLKSGDKTISMFNKGKATVTVEIPANLLNKKVAAVHIGDDNQLEQLAGKLLTVGTKKSYTFTTSHFSTFALVDAEALGLETDELIAEQVKEKVADLKLTARSAKTSKKNIKVTLKMDEANRAVIDELKEAGYTVKYKFYRSTRKASKYAAKVTTKTGAYTNTAGKKGTKYYYKARVQVYDADGKLVARTQLKQCKYASRTWSK